MHFERIVIPSRSVICVIHGFHETVVIYTLKCNTYRNFQGLVQCGLNQCVPVYQNRPQHHVEGLKILLIPAKILIKRTQESSKV